MSQFHPTQHGGDSDFQVWQQQMMYKQLQEFQRQQQVQQLDHGARMQPSFGQFQAPAKPLPTDQLSAMTNEMPNNESTAYAWSHQLHGSSDPGLASNSQMLNPSSNTNWEQYGGAPGVANFVNGSMFSNTPIQPMRPMGLAAHQMNPSLYPINTTSRDGSGNQHSQFLGIPTDPRNAMARAAAHQSEKASMQFSSLMSEQGPSSSMQNFLGKVGDNIKVGTPVPVNHLQHGVQHQDFHGRPNQVDFQAGLREKSTMQVESGNGGASLDPTEEKFLFGNDEDSNWGALLRGGNDHGSSMDNDNFGGALPSLQSGSWSALMQEALQSTTSDNSPKEEWSGLSFQKQEQIIANNSTLQSHDQNKFSALSGANLENQRASSASSYGDGTMHNPNFAGFQHAARTPYEQRDRMQHDSSNATGTNHQSTAGVNNGYFQQSMKQKQSDDYSRQEQMNASNGIWAHQKPEMPRNNSHSSGGHATPPSAHGFWMSQQNSIDHNISRESGSTQNDWKSKGPLVQDINSTPNVFNNDGSFWKSSGGNANSVHRPQQMKPDISTMQMPNDSSDGKSTSAMGSNMPTLNQDQYQSIIGRTGEHVGQNHNMGRKGPEITGSLGRGAEQKSNDHNQDYLNVLPTERQGHGSNHGQHVSSDFATRRHPFFAGKESQNLGQSGQQAMGSYMLQNHAMDNSGMNIRHSSGNPVPNQFPSQSHQLHNNLKPRFIPSSQASSNMASVNEKMLMREEQFKSRHVPNSSSSPPFGGSDAGLPQNRAVQNSQHMLQLLHKVDNSTDSNAAADMPNSSPDNTGTVQQQLNQSSLQGFGLRLAPPSQRQLTPGHVWSTRADVDGKQPEHSTKGEDQTQPSAASQSLPPGHPSSQPTPFNSSEIDSTGQQTGQFHQFGSGQQYPVSESRSGSVAMPQQGSSATVFKNVWTNISAQRLAGVQPNKITPNILQSMMFPNSAADTNLWGSQKADDQGQRASTPSDVATSSTNSQNQETKQGGDSDAGLASSEMVNLDSTGATMSRESIQKHSSDGNFAMHVSSLSRLHQQGIMNPKQGENPAANFQAMKTSQNTAIGLHGSPTPSNIQQQNYSLLHQMQAMRHVDVDPANIAGKKLKSPETGSDASQVDWKSGQRFAHGTNNSVRSSVDNIGNANVPGPFPADMKMLSFAPRNNEDRGPSIPSQFPSREPPSQGMAVAAQTEQQTQVQPANASSDLIERSERPRINPQMAPSWFERYGNHRNGQNLSMFNLQKTPVPPYNVQKPSWNMDNNSAEQRIDSGQSVKPGHYISSKKMEVSVPSSIMQRRPKKRKSAESDLVSWHKLIEHPKTLRNMSTTEMDWAWAANRLMEKAEDDAENLEDVPVNYLWRKRLRLTTRLIQQILPAIPAKVLRAQAASAYEGVTYNIAMFTLGDACNMASYNSRTLTDHENNSSEQTNAKKMEDRLSKVVEVFTGRIKKMENDFVSLNKRSSMLDVQLECQDLERISIVNRLGRFHGRNHAAGVEASSASEMIPRRIFPERHVMSFAVPGNLPEGVYCLSL
ncbi:hypothetical protein OsI_10510 [Oryza sativa Indica Group]|uniref:Uncharacterized protein n=1 Tax=Oryza sativa subsp. indica TaxID=39946 RepID=A2XDW6_ORYSI|nr:hypothetical protein OsI_10510 [Oryza sativa Indica Group]